MTQAMTEANANAEAQEAESGAPAALSPDLLRDLAEDLRPPVAPADDADDADEEDGPPTGTRTDDASDADANASPDEADAGDAAEPPPSPEQEVATWADLTFDNPQTAARIPKNRLPEVFTEWRNRMQTAFDAGVTQGIQHAQTNAQRTSMQAEVARIEALLEDGDADSYLEEVEKFPGGKANFKRVSADLEPVQANSPQAFTQRADTILKQLSPYPELLEQMKSEWGQRNYKATDEDLIRLAVDVGQMVGARGKASTPAKTELQKRQEGLNGLKARPKPDVSEGRNSPGNAEPTAAELLKWSPEQFQAAEEKKPGSLRRYSDILAGKK